MTSSPPSAARLADVRDAFDSIAAVYDGPAGNNAAVQEMRAALWRAAEERFAPGTRLLDLGCGAGIDALHFASCGHSVTAVDWSPGMVEQTRARIDAAGVAGRVTVRTLGMHELDGLRGEAFDGIYSDLGALNCAPDARDVVTGCAALLSPGGQIVLSVIGRICPWEMAWYLAHGDTRRALLRRTSGAVPVPLNGRTVWTRYYTPSELYRSFAPQFDLVSYRALRLFAPPPYLEGVRRRLPWLSAAGLWLDDRLGGRPILRNAGDHFLMTLVRRP